MVNKEEKSANHLKVLKLVHSQWKSSSALERQQLYSKIEQVKQPCNDLFNKRIHIQNQLRNRRKQLHIKRMEILTHAQVIDKGSYGLAKAENSLFSPNFNVAQDFKFSETDNSLRTVSDTAVFILKRFKFHLELYNRYQVLGDVQNGDPHLANILERYHSNATDPECMDESVSYLDLPNSFNVKS
ncbi:hypothetical protein BCV72DRAFT_329636 [Rhizopus microsporus var. microsporus]|uniref:Uncharacterized protein n=2 Tax=Rhizopus microsporus TaxID=58291 RepID=A0A2G4SGU5_RHIZD|nr:uncharacterized protein RHIMIDRAFT_248193 [Rhizopus microsporus ATCC 52813]ORE10986.1 hypothetical protein BCV72DRAFT_329636 [Rhizopus microsporus var. microsporus]PHZ07990.1 hypothetical protein RHIMIDRAFT_248193 [Rhizopus microsporus ATCC 52813]